MKEYHISDESEIADVRIEMKKLFEEEDPCIQKIMQLDVHMGYGYGFPF